MRRRRKVQPIASAPLPPPEDSDLVLLADDTAWRAVGAELRRLDPRRYVAILKVCREMVDIHRDPFVRFDRDGN